MNIPFIVSDDTFKIHKFRQISKTVSQGVVARKGKATKTISDTGDITVKCINLQMLPMKK